MGVTVLRLANPYGPFSEHRDTLIPRVLRQLGDGSDPVIFGDGLQTRDFIHASDVARAIWLALSRAAGYAVYNVGSGTGRSVNEVVALLRRLTGGGSKAAYLPARAGDIRHSVADIGAIERELGFVARVGLGEFSVDI